MNEPDKAWLASAIDGEGCITHGRRKSHSYSLNETQGYSVVYISIVNTNRAYIEKASLLMDNATVYVDHSELRGNRKPCYKVVLSKRTSVLRILSEVLPYLIIKKQKATDMVALIESLPKTSLELYQQALEKDPSLRRKIAAPLINFYKHCLPQKRSEIRRKAWASRDPEEIKRTQTELARRSVLKYTPEMRSHTMRKWWSQFTLEERSKMNSERYKHRR